jgi:arginine utilization protein RocB
LSQLSKALESLTDQPTTPPNAFKSIQRQHEYYTPTDPKAVQELIATQFSATKVINYMAKAAIKAMADVITKRATNQELFKAIKRKKAHAQRTTANLGKAQVISMEVV